MAHGTKCCNTNGYLCQCRVKGCHTCKCSGPKPCLKRTCQGCQCKGCDSCRK